MSVRFREVLECFRRNELLNWEWFESTYSPSLRDGTPDCPATVVFGADEVGRAQWEDFRKRVIEHVRIMMALEFSWGNISMNCAHLEIISWVFHSEWHCCCYCYYYYYYLLQNIRVLAKYYTRIRMDRLSELLSLPVDVSTY